MHLEFLPKMVSHKIDPFPINFNYCKLIGKINFIGALKHCLLPQVLFSRLIVQLDTKLHTFTHHMKLIRNKLIVRMTHVSTIHECFSQDSCFPLVQSVKQLFHSLEFHILHIILMLTLLVSNCRPTIFRCYYSTGSCNLENNKNQACNHI